jgi:hypothetical protein
LYSQSFAIMFAKACHWNLSVASSIQYTPKASIKILKQIIACRRTQHSIIFRIKCNFSCNSSENGTKAFERYWHRLNTFLQEGYCNKCSCSVLNFTVSYMLF